MTQPQAQPGSHKAECENSLKQLEEMLTTIKLLELNAKITALEEAQKQNINRSSNAGGGPGYS